MDIYWIHHKSHTDIMTQGYVGISKDAIKRFDQHKREPNQHLKAALSKYGDDICIDVIVKASDEYAMIIEEKLRPEENVGWNIAKGGGIPPKSDSHRAQKISDIKRQRGTHKQSKQTTEKRVLSRKRNGTLSGWKVEGDYFERSERGKRIWEERVKTGNHRVSEERIRKGVETAKSNNSYAKGWEKRRSKSSKN